MEANLGKLFIGGISWETDEDSLNEYFRAYGEVVEAVIMRDRVTGRARGFGFVVFADPVVAERVVREKHMIDGRTVEAKKAVPREGHVNRNANSIQGSPGPGHTKKIFVGGLASTVTDSDFKLYFDQFGTITDVVVMYDQNTQRPRGFGFITYDSEEAIDRVLHKSFHELDGKTVEVKRAVPKELSPSPARSPLLGYNFGIGRTNNFLDNYAHGYNLGTVGGYAVRMDGRLSPVAAARSGFSPFGSPAYGMNMSVEPGLNPSFGASINLANTLGYGRVLGSYYGGDSTRYNTPIGVNGESGRTESFLNSPTRNLWGDGSLNSSSNSSTSGAYMGSGNRSFGVLGNSGANWGSTPISTQVGRSGAMGYGVGENNYWLGAGGVGRNNGPGVAAVAPSFNASSGAFEGSYRDFFSGNSIYRDAAWQTPSPQLDGSGSLGYKIRHAADATAKSSEGYNGNYSIANRQTNKGIAAQEKSLSGDQKVI